ncbi:MAG TPA: HAMP domain-containing sensor histidine kinase [Saprospiraceae bacterium]|nr:HAMP domain-containing sensor histidine kinase [Saprospiraceae bacterium]HMQ82209.1 HAMP domain-containing sensor histidine kinase [Saprospiraceae bacterium]
MKSCQEQLVELQMQLEAVRKAEQQFTSEAAHELQTPLSIIKGQVELLIQSPHLQESDMQRLAIILNHTNRLARLNKALLLLAKIDHISSEDTPHKVDMKTIVEQLLEQYQDMLELRQIKISQSLTPSEVNMNQTLAEVFINNLIQNAIRHNIAEGYIEINLSPEGLIISNSGGELASDPEVLFERFRRESANEESLGLGLSIVRRIAEHYGFEVRYRYENRKHTLIVDFSGW